MNKTLLFFLFTILSTTAIRAQIKLGLIGGIHSASVQETNNVPGWDTAYKPYYASRSGFHLGILVEIPLGNSRFFLQPGINYSSKGRQFSKFNDSNTATVTDTIFSQNTLKLGYMELPLYFTYKIPLSASHKSSFFISAGPYFAFFYDGNLNTQNRIKSTNKYNNNDEDLLVGNAVDKYKTFDFGVNAKAGFELGSVMLSGYFSQGLSNFYTAPYSGTFHHQLVGATLGIWLTKTTPHAKVAKKEKTDTDHDGVPDDEDLCPTKPGTLARHGCPVPDTDGDGIDDDHDLCKTVPGVAKYHGCPIPDTDGDGVNDEEDSCKTIAGSAKYHGCPVPDKDHDGINDEQDRCPDQPGTAANHGCPVIKKEITEKVKYAAKSILFATASDQLTKGSYAALDDLAGILKTHPELHLVIEGHTDSVGTAEHNIILSQKRADAVKIYLLKKGIADAKVEAIGMGEANPIATNGTPEGKAINRRVELKLTVGKN